MRSCRDQKGIALIMVVGIVAVVGVLVSGLPAVVANYMRFVHAQVAMGEARWAAESGILRAVTDYRAQGGWRTVAACPVYNELRKDTDGWRDMRFTVGVDADFLLVDALAPRIIDDGAGGVSTVLAGVTIGTVSSAPGYTITAKRMKVDWASAGTDPSFDNARLTQMTIAGTVFYQGSVAAGTVVDLIYDAAGTTGDPAAEVQLSFDRTIPKDATVCMTLYFSDGSARQAVLYDNGRSGNKEFSVTSIGESAGVGVWRRTLTATYDVQVGMITSWSER